MCDGRHGEIGIGREWRGGKRAVNGRGSVVDGERKSCVGNLEREPRWGGGGQCWAMVAANQGWRQRQLNGGGGSTRSAATRGRAEVAAVGLLPQSSLSSDEVFYVVVKTHKRQSNKIYRVNIL